MHLGRESGWGRSVGLEANGRTFTLNEMLLSHMRCKSHMIGLPHGKNCEISEVKKGKVD